MTPEASEVPRQSQLDAPAAPQPALQSSRPRGQSPVRPVDAITSWLDMLETLLRLPARDRADIREELESHLRDRTHDLMFSGLDADQAARRATTELGEAADVAGRFHDTRTHVKRKQIMNVLGIGMAAAAVVVSVSALVANSGSARLKVVLSDPPVATDGQPTGSGQYRLQLEPRVVGGELQLDVVPIASDITISSTSVLRPGTTEDVAATLEGSIQSQLLAAQARTTEIQRAVETLRSMIVVEKAAGRSEASVSSFAAPPAVFTADDGQLPVTNRFSVTFQGTRLHEALQFAARAIDRTLVIDQQALGEIKLDKESVVSAASAEVDLPGFFALLRSALGAPNNQVDLLEYRLTEATLEVSTRDGFDRRDTVLSAYDIDDLLSIPDVDADRLRETLKAIVFPGGWEENGGNTARAHVVGRTLFIEAPGRYHQKIQWIFGEIRKGGAAWLGGNQGGEHKTGSEATQAQPVIERYPIQHLAAAEALESIMKLNSIRRVDFTRFSADPHTNTIIGLVAPEDHELVKGAIQDIDKPTGVEHSARPDGARGR